MWSIPLGMDGSHHFMALSDLLESQLHQSTKATLLTLVSQLCCKVREEVLAVRWILLT